MMEPTDVCRIEEELVFPPYEAAAKGLGLIFLYNLRAVGGEIDIPKDSIP